jgi:hypothetical protein
MHYLSRLISMPSPHLSKGVEYIFIFEHTCNSLWLEFQTTPQTPLVQWQRTSSSITIFRNQLAHVFQQRADLAISQPEAQDAGLESPDSMLRKSRSSSSRMDVPSWTSFVRAETLLTALERNPRRLARLLVDIRQIYRSPYAWYR